MRFATKALLAISLVLGIASTTVAQTADVTPPTLTITSQPPPTTSDTTATISFVASDTGSGIDVVICEVVGGATNTFCLSPLIITDLSLGTHTVRITALDLAGNTTTQTIQWEVVPPGPPAPQLSFLGVTSSGANAPDQKIDNFLGPIGRPQFFWTTNRSDLTYNITVTTLRGQTVCSAQNVTPVISGTRASFAFGPSCRLRNRDTYNVTITGTSPTGQTATTQGTFVVDFSAPTLSLRGAASESDYTVRIIATDSGSGIGEMQCVLHFQALPAQSMKCGANSSVLLQGVTNMPFELVVTAKDNAGNVSTHSVKRGGD